MRSHPEHDLCHLDRTQRQGVFPLVWCAEWKGLIAIKLELDSKCCAPPAASKTPSRLVEPLGFSAVVLQQKKSPASQTRGIVFGGEGGIRTLDTLLTYTPLAGARLQPLGHFSINLSTVLPVKLVRRARSRVAAKLSLLVSSRPPFVRPKCLRI